MNVGSRIGYNPYNFQNRLKPQPQTQDAHQIKFAAVKEEPDLIGEEETPL